MRITVRSKNLQITPAMRAEIDTKLIKPTARLLGKESGEILSRFQQESRIRDPRYNISRSGPLLDIECSCTTSHHHKGKVFQVLANLSIGRKLLRAQAEAETMHAACDKIKNALEQELKHFKNKRTTQMKRSARSAKQELRYDPAARLNKKGRVRDEGL